jgi:hypothetical protein
MSHGQRHMPPTDRAARDVDTAGARGRAVRELVMFVQWS